MTGVQLIGKSSVLNRFESFDAGAWVLLQGKEFIVSGVGSDELGGWLSDLERTGSDAAYTLRVYDRDDAPTPSEAGNSYLANIRFKLQDTYNGAGIAGYNNKLIGRVEELEKQVQRHHDNDDSDEPDRGIGAIIMDWLENPVKLGQIAGAIRTIIDGYRGTKVVPIPSEPGQAIAGIDPIRKEAELQRLSAAIDALEKKDERLVEHLEKLAKLSKDDELLFRAILSKLDEL